MNTLLIITSFHLHSLVLDQEYWACSIEIYWWYSCAMITKLQLLPSWICKAFDCINHDVQQSLNLHINYSSQIISHHFPISTRANFNYCSKNGAHQVKIYLMPENYNCGENLFLQGRNSLLCVKKITHWENSLHYVYAHFSTHLTALMHLQN